MQVPAMTIQIELNPELEARLAAAAKTQGLPVEGYAQQLLQQAISDRFRHAVRASQQEFRAFLDTLANNASEPAHLDTETFSRSMIYGDHD